MSLPTNLILSRRKDCTRLWDMLLITSDVILSLAQSERSYLVNSIKVSSCPTCSKLLQQTTLTLLPPILWTFVPDRTSIRRSASQMAPAKVEKVWKVCGKHRSRAHLKESQSNLLNKFRRWLRISRTLPRKKWTICEDKRMKSLNNTSSRLKERRDSLPSNSKSWEEPPKLKVPAL